MAEKKRALGKGLSALLNNQDTGITKNEIISNTKIKNEISVIKHGIEKHWISTKSFKK